MKRKANKRSLGLKSRGMKSSIALVWIVVFLLFSGGVEAKEVPQEMISWGEVAGDLGFGVLGVDVFTTFQLGADIKEGDVSAGLQAALRIRTVDMGEKSKTTIRREDWDEPSDFAHIIRYLTYGKRLRSVSFGLHLGEICPAGLGNGTLFDNYHSVVDLDHPHSGLQARVKHKYFGFDFIMDDFVGPRMFGIRGEFRPFPFLRGFSFGVTGVTDIKAPRSVLLDSEGERRVSKTKRLLVDTEILGFVGYDFSYIFGKKQGFWLKPYIDNNWSVGHGGGLHAGISLGGKIFGGKMSLMGSAEYRLGWKGYDPEYFDLFYDIQRYQVPLDSSWNTGSSSLETKLSSLDRFPAFSHGGKWEARLAYEKIFWLRGAYSLQEGPLGDMAFLEVGVPYGRSWVVSGLVAKTGLFDKESYVSSDGLLAAAEAKVEIFKYFYLLGQFRYLYALDDMGVFRGVLMANLAVGGRWGF